MKTRVLAILCTERDKFDVEYALRGVNKPVGVSELKLTKDLPEELTNQLPDPEQLEEKIYFEMGLKGDVDKIK